MNETIDYYNKNADAFASGTVNVDFRDKEDLYREIGDEYNALGNKERADYFYALEDAERGSRRNYSGRIVNAPEVKPKKIYPNDPCPRESGKKYKKCCGRKA